MKFHQWLFPLTVSLVVFLPRVTPRSIAPNSTTSTSDRSGRFLGLLGFLAGVTNGLYFDADLYSDEDSSEVKVKATVDKRRNKNWAYIPIPYFIPSQLYNNLFFNPAAQFPPFDALVNPGSSSIPVPPPIANQPLKDPDSEAVVAQLENPTVKIISTRGRLTRQALKQKEKQEQQKKKKMKDDAEDTADKDAISTEVKEDEDVAGAETNLTTANSGISEAPTETSSANLVSESTSSNSSTPSTEMTNTSSESSTGVGAEKDPILITTTPETFEVGEWEFLNGTSAAFNQTSSSSYYRRKPQSFDPANVSFTTWYPSVSSSSSSSSGEASKVQSANFAYPFRPSVEHTDQVVFKPLAYTSPGLEPPALPSSYYAVK